MNRILYCDCLDESEGLPSLPDKSIDLCLTDPPWGVNIGKTMLKDRKYVNGRILKAKSPDLMYNDEWNPEWNLRWFKQLERICKAIILVVGQKRVIWWIQNTNPIGILAITHTNGYSSTKISRWNKFSPYLVFGKLNKRLFSNVIEFVIPWGFLSNKEFIHPSQKGLEIPLKILQETETTSMIDPFSGSGSYIKAADLLGIKWIGYEINEKYKVDIDKRFKDTRTLADLGYDDSEEEWQGEILI